MNSLMYIAVIPIILLLMYIYKKDKNKEPIGLLKKIFIWGLICFVPILIIEGIFTLFFDIEDNSNYFRLFLTTLFGIGLIEEFFKWIVVYKITFNNKEFDEVYDAIVYSVCSSLFNNVSSEFSSAWTGVANAIPAFPVSIADNVAAANLDFKFFFFIILLPLISYVIIF